MSRCGKATMSLGVAYILTLGIGMSCGQPGPDKPVAPPRQLLETAPLTVAASNVGDYANGRSWHLSVNSAGKAELTVESDPGPVRVSFTVPERSLTELRKALIEQRFFELNDEYGEHVLCGGVYALTVTAGADSRSVKVYFLGNWENNGELAKLREPARALRLLVLLRSWFDHADAFDLRP